MRLKTSAEKIELVINGERAYNWSANASPILTTAGPSSE
ncbi:hypothetical protein UC8_12670 [Roseimaritima ulvae]|uniref:Uncharacterized protein n=1 Tax=Roseimaritima ulvae TaxID=980254 RepID=A0A5B9QZ90_9BACT|nr:hypothetical protein UC8_12670 [Roseimaritima ulvae]